MDLDNRFIMVVFFGNGDLSHWLEGTVSTVPARMRMRWANMDSLELKP